MSEPFLSEIKLMSFNFPPRGWALCNGQILPINQNQPLFALLGTTYGGNGQTTFALPNLRGRVPIHRGNGHTLGESAGSTAVTLNIQQMPQHTHVLQGTTAANAPTPVPSNAVLLGDSPSQPYAAGTSNGQTALLPGSISSVGGSQAHENMQPYLVLNFCIALQGTFPSQN